MAKKGTSKGAGGGVPTAKVRLGGKQYTLRLSFGALVEVERIAGVNMMLTPLHRLNVQAFTTLVWAAIEQDEKPALDEVRKLIGPHNSAKIQAAIIEAWNASLPDPDDETETSEGNESGTGMISSQPV